MVLFRKKYFQHFLHYNCIWNLLSKDLHLVYACFESHIIISHNLTSLYLDILKISLEGLQPHLLPLVAALISFIECFPFILGKSAWSNPKKDALIQGSLQMIECKGVHFLSLLLINIIIGLESVPVFWITLSFLNYIP